MSLDTSKINIEKVVKNVDGSVALLAIVPAITVNGDVFLGEVRVLKLNQSTNDDGKLVCSLDIIENMKTQNFVETLGTPDDNTFKVKDKLGDYAYLYWYMVNVLLDQ